MSSLAQELDATLEDLEPSSAAALAGMVREAMQRVRGKSTSARRSIDLGKWEQRLASHGQHLATGKQGAPLQQVMDDLRS